LAISIGTTVAIDMINPFKLVGWEGVSLSALDVNLINTIEHSEKHCKITFKDKEIELWS
tara:strand:- start:288 stop:464 length:177 start_codon:yes stop_codon:yes gene_type:complete